ncbi:MULTISPECIES: DNA gyrase subunit A [unclassified Chitinophaga]|uniref:DNA gyrase subunit A n=1 Tax=unclassified Chitinophaga TaxID=2619133 RepID=UPI0009CCA888|nr:MULTISPECIES: DNA gyrase subunit A [unclassified Chitinophaga]OMP75927.1 DNA gyrase subunit A [[Flexibacter] sp. ATCC 35208]WPV64205.1 DNA gyrase subunit A [Chitinophaga sp. LS1]
MSENTENSQDGRIVQINIEEQMKTAYIDYSMSVIVGRALPDVRDGLKPVHRRVLFGMSELGNNSNKPYKKSARIVGEVMGKYHPHGDASIYDTIVRLAQPWTLRYILVDGQGNFGSVDGDAPAAMRYTEIRLQKIAEAMLEDLDKETVDFSLNFDDTLEEPTVLPTRIPNLLVNGASGIAVGMATNIMPHNLTEVVDGLIAYIENKEITSEELIKYVKAPDFPTGGIIYGYEGVKQGFETGRGRVVVRGKVNVETTKAGRERLVIYELPYQINKAVLHQKIAQLADDKIIEGIAEVRDESDREGMRLVIDLKREAIANVVINQLYKYSELQTSYGINNVALVKGRPRVLALKELLSEFVEFRHEVVVRRTRFDLRKAEEKAHILQGYLIALDHLDEVIALIRGSRTPEEAKDGLISQFELSELQAKAILELRLQRLTGMERDKIKEEFDEIMKLISHLKDVLNDEGMRFKIIREELEDVKKRFGDERKTEIQYLASEMRMEDIIAEEDVVITISHLGYIKRTSAYDYRQQKRGGRGALGGKTREEDYIEHLFVASTHHTMLFFTEKGRCYWLKVYEIPEGEKSGKGRAIQNLINLPTDDKIRAIIDIKDLGDKDFINSNYIVLCTANGIIKKTMLEEFSRPRQNGVNAITINEGDQLLEAKLTNGNSEIMMAIKSGRAIRFPENTVRDTGRGAIGVRGIEVDNDKDEVVGMICVNKDENRTVLVVSENGFGKRTDIEEYRVTNRGGKGVKTINVTEKTGRLIAILDVTEKDDLMITCKSGITIRMAVGDIREAGRATQGVRLIRLDDTDQIAAVARLDEQEEQGVEQDLENVEQEIAQQEISDAEATSGEETTDEDQAPTEEAPNE